MKICLICKLNDTDEQYCKKCRSEYHRKWRKKNREHVKEKAAKYYEENKEVLLEKQRIYRERRKEKA